MLLKDIKINKAMGPDCIPNMLLRELGEKNVPVYQNLFTQGLNGGALPSDWRNANIGHLFKKRR